MKSSTQSVLTERTKKTGFIEGIKLGTSCAEVFEAAVAAYLDQYDN